MKNFYDQLQKTLDEVPRHDMVMVMGDWNAGAGERQEGESGIVGQHGLKCERNKNDDRFVAFCASNKIAVTSTAFPHKDTQVHKCSPDGQHQKQTDHMTVRSRFKRSVQDTRAHRGVDVGSDHNLVITKTKLRLNSTGKKQKGTDRYQESKLKVFKIRQQFKLELRKKIQRLQMLDQNVRDRDYADHQNSEQPKLANNIEHRWQKIKAAYTETALKLLVRRKKKCQCSVSIDSWRKIEERRKLKKIIDDARSERLKNKARDEYREKEKEV